MEGEDGSKNNKKGVRRPMNAFLIFCKRQRSKVREKNPQMDNRSITRVLGDIWAKMDKDEKASFTLLAKQYKDAFMKANPGYKWHSSDRVHSGTGGNASSKNGSSTTGTTTTGKHSSTALSNKHQHFQDIRVSTEITPGKLADPCQMGGLNLLLKAGKESELMQSKSKPSVTNSSSSSLSSLFSFTPISIPPPTKPCFGQTLSSSSASSSLSVPRPRNAASMMNSQKSNRIPISSSSSSSLMTESATTNSALLQLAEMCTTELYSSTEEHSAPQLSPNSLVTVAPPKKRAKQWHSQSSPLVDDNGRKHSPGSNSSTSGVRDTVVTDKGKRLTGRIDLPLDLSQTNDSTKSAKKTNSKKQNKGMKGGGKDSLQTWSRKRKVSSSATDSVSSSSSPSVSPINLEGTLITSVASQLRNGASKFTGMPVDNNKTGHSRSNFSAPGVDISSQLPHQKSTNCDSNHFGVGHEIYKPLRRDDSAPLSYPCHSSESSKIASLLKATSRQPLPPSQQTPPHNISLSPNERGDRSCCDNNFTKMQQVESVNLSFAATPTNATSMVVSSHFQPQQQPFTQGKVKKKWTQRMMVEAKQEEELALAKKESQQLSNPTALGSALPISMPQNSHSTSLGGSDRQRAIVSHCSNHDADIVKSKVDSTLFRHPWGEINSSKYPLAPPPPINTSFPLPISGEAHKSHTLYKALTSEISPPRHRSATVAHDSVRHSPVPSPSTMSSSSSPSLHRQDKQNSHRNIFDPITACGKKFTDHIVEQLVLHGASNDKKDVIMPPPIQSSTALFPPSSSPSKQHLQQLTDKSSGHLFNDKNLLLYSKSPIKSRESVTTSNSKSGAGIWDHMPTHFPVDRNEHFDRKNSDWRPLEKKELDSSSFPASSLFEKVARKVSRPQRDNGSPRENGVCLPTDHKTEMPDPVNGRAGSVSSHSPSTTSSSPQSQLSCPDLFSNVGNSATVRRHQLADSDVRHPSHEGHFIMEDGRSPPVRKSRRANRGQKYQALIKEGIIQPSKERLAVRNIPRAVRSLSCKEEDQQLIPELARANSCRERATPSPRTVKSRASPIELFDFENGLAIQPLVSLVLPPQVPSRHPPLKRKRKVDEKVVTTTTKRFCGSKGDGCHSPSVSDAVVEKDEAGGSDMFVQVHRHGKLYFDKRNPHSGATLKVKRHMRNKCSTRVPLTQAELKVIDSKTSGSAKRWVQTLRVLHIIHEGSDEEDCVPPPKKAKSSKHDGKIALVKADVIPNKCSTTSSPLSSSDVAITTTTPLQKNSPATSTDLSPLSTQTSVSPSRLVSKTDFSPIHNIATDSLHFAGISSKPNTPKKCDDDSMLSPLHLLTTAAMQSERAVYPTIPKSFSVGENLFSSPPFNSANLISPRPASVPFVEDNGQMSRGTYGQNFGDDKSSSIQMPSSLGSYSAQQQSSSYLSDRPIVSSVDQYTAASSSLPTTTRTSLMSGIESPSKRLASSALLSLSLSASAFDVPPLDHCKQKEKTRLKQPSFSLPSSPHIVSTLFAPPPSSSTPAAPALKKKTYSTPTLLNIPTISTSAGSFSFTDMQKNTGFSNNGQGMLNVPVPDHRSRHQMIDHNSTHKQSVMQHSQKLVRLLTTNNNDDAMSDNSGFTDKSLTNTSSSMKPSESLPISHSNSDSAAITGSNISGFHAKHPDSQPRKRNVAGNNTKPPKQRKRQKPTQQQQQQQQHPQQQQSIAYQQPPTPVHVVRGLSGSKLFPSLPPINYQTTAVMPPTPVATTTAPITSHKAIASDANTGSGTPTTAKKHKPTIWDHLSSQCPVPLKSNKQSVQAAAVPTAMTANSQHVQRHPSQPAATATSHALPSTPVVPTPALTNNRPGVGVGGSNGGSDTDSADEDDDNEERALCIVEGDEAPSDTDSAEESEFDTAVTTPVLSPPVKNNILGSETTTASLVPSSTVNVSCVQSNFSANNSDSNNMCLSYSPNIVSRPALLGSSTQEHMSNFNRVTNPQEGPRGVIVSTLVHPPTASPSFVPSIASPAPVIVPSAPNSNNKDNCIVVAKESSLPSNFVSVSSITLPSDLPDAERELLPVPSPSLTAASSLGSNTTRHDTSSLRNVLISASDADPSLSGKVTVKTIAPTSPFPSPHVTDLSSSTTAAPPLPPPPPPSASSSYSSLPVPAPHIATTTSYGNILLSTLQNPHFIFIPHHQQQNHAATTGFSQVYLPLTTSAPSTTSTSNTDTITYPAAATQ